MSTFTSPEFTLKNDINKVKETLTDFNKISKVIEKAPSNKVQIVSVEDDSITVKSSMTGPITLQLSEATDNKLVYKTTSSPIPLTLVVDLEERDGQSYGRLTLDASIPPFLMGMVRGKLDPAMERMAAAVSEIDIDRLNL